MSARSRRRPGGGLGSPPAVSLCGSRAAARSGLVPGAGLAGVQCSCYYQGHGLPFQPLKRRVHIPGGTWSGFERFAQRLEILMHINVFKISLWKRLIRKRKKKLVGASLVARWLRIRLPMQGDVGYSPGLGRSHMPRNS